jgi:hypothetical protein
MLENRRLWRYLRLRGAFVSGVCGSIRPLRSALETKAKGDPDDLRRMQGC